MTKSNKKDEQNDSPGGMMFPGLNDEYFNQPVMFHDCDDHYELIYTGEFEDVGRESIAVTKLIRDLKDGDKDMELHILINSIGGSVDNLSFVLQQVLQYRHRVTVCCGSALSAGFILWACGHEKYVSPYSELMYHTIYSGYEGKGTELASYGNHVERLTDQLMEAVDMKSLISEEDMQKGKSTEVWYLGRDFIAAGKAKDYSEYVKREIPITLAITLAGNRFFAKAGENYMELVLNTEKEFSYTDLLDIHKKAQEEDEKESPVDLPKPDEADSSSGEEGGDEGEKKQKKQKKRRKRKLKV